MLSASSENMACPSRTMVEGSKQGHDLDWKGVVLHACDSDLHPVCTLGSMSVIIDFPFKHGKAGGEDAKPWGACRKAGTLHGGQVHCWGLLFRAVLQN
eukprot:1154173-Pelagomonas_calceolata.AAC.8